MRSGAKTYIVEVGPIEYFGSSKSELNRNERVLRKALDDYARRLVMVGPRSKVVRTRVEPSTKRGPSDG